MYNVREWWLKIAEGLPVGGTTKVAHIEDGTGKSDSVLIYNLVNGYGAKCYRRGTSDWVSKDSVNLVELAEALEISAKCDLPEDMGKYLPSLNLPYQSLASSYLLKRNIDPESIDAYVSQSRMRLIFYGVDTSGTFGYIGRDITEKHKAKVVNYQTSKGRIQNLVLNISLSFNTVVLTEDILSATKIQYVARRYGLPLGEVISLNGTKGSDSLSLYLMDKDVLIWLDGDSAGVQGSVKLYRDLQSIAKSVKIIQGEGDPKDYSYQDIQDIVSTGTLDTGSNKVIVQEVIKGD